MLKIEVLSIIAFLVSLLLSCVKILSFEVGAWSVLISFLLMTLSAFAIDEKTTKKQVITFLLGLIIIAAYLSVIIIVLKVKILAKYIAFGSLISYICLGFAHILGLMLYNLEFKHSDFLLNITYPLLLAYVLPSVPIAFAAFYALQKY